MIKISDKKELLEKIKLNQHVLIENIHSLERTDIFYLIPIIAWKVTKNKRLMDTTLFDWADPIFPLDWADTNFDHEKDVVSETIIPAHNSFAIREFDSDEETYFIDGVVNSFSQYYGTIDAFFDKRLKELILKLEKDIAISEKKQ
jgi:hypothetical protein